MKGLLLITLVCLLCAITAFGQTPGPAGAISGSSLVCEGSSGIFYSVQPISNATSYQWTFSGGPVSIIGSSSSNTISLSFSANYPSAGITITVNGVNGSGSGTVSPAFSVSVLKQPGATGAISGPTIVCPGQTSVTYSIAPVAGANSYSWTAPAGATLSSGSGTSRVFNFSSTFTSGQVRVFVVNGQCGVGPSSTLTVSGQQPVGAAGAITGLSSVCPGQTSVTYGVSAIANATGYVWNLPSGATILSGQNTNSIIVNYSSSSPSGNVSVYGTNCMGNGTSSSLSVAVGQMPGAAGTISGSSSVCEGSSGIVFTVQPISNATSYQWTFSEPVSVIGGSTGSTISLSFPTNYPTASIAITVKGVNNCGNGIISSAFPVSVFKPAGATGAISGPTTVCPGQSSVTYSIAPIAGANSYTWTAPAGATLSSGSGTSREFNFSSTFTSGQVGVFVVNGQCGAGPSSTLTVSGQQPVGAAGVITGLSSVCPGQTSVTYGVSAIANATGYVWSLPSGATILSGQNTNSIIVNYSSSPSGNVSVYGTNCVGNGIPSSLAVSTCQVPGAAGTISGSSSVCEGSSGIIFTVQPISNATSYQWTFSGGPVSGVGSLTGNTITINFAANYPSSGITITVNGVNSSGNGIVSPAFAVSILKPAGATGPISGATLVCPGQSSVGYSIAPVAGALSYVWNSTGNATITNSGTSATMNFSSSFTGGRLTVFVVNGPCGAGPSSFLDIAIPQIPANAGTIAGSSIVCPSQSEVAYSIPIIANATGYVWSVPVGAIIASGANTNSIIVNYPPGSTNGNITVNGTNCMGNGGSSSLAVTIQSLPGAAGIIAGNTLVCPGEGSEVYGVPPIPNASEYVWNVPTGAIITSGENTNSISVNFPVASLDGIVSVYGTNCGISGASSSLTVKTKGSLGAGSVAHSVDLVTGAMSASIPLFSIQDGDVQVPVSLSYTSGGVRVTDDDGWVGMNWNLSAQSFRITREMRGLPDDYTATGLDNRKGWLIGSTATSIKNFIPSTDSDPTTCTDELTNYNFLNGIDYNQDTEPDAFHVNAPGLSFQFFFDENKQPQVIPQQDVIIIPNPNPVTGSITSFTVKDSKGVQYIFNEKETLTQSLTGTNPYYLVRKCQLHKNAFTYTTAWYLTKIISPIYGTIDITYKTVNTADNTYYPNYRNRIPYKYKFPLIAVDYFNFNSGVTAQPGDDYKIHIEYSRSSVLKILDKVSSPSMEAQFISTPKFPGFAMERLNSINLYDKREGTTKLVKEIMLSYETTTPPPLFRDKRTFLTGVKEKIACIELQYGLEYYNSTLLPEFKTRNMDDWEFYKINPDNNEFNGNPNYTNYEETTIAGSLKMITHPLKGYTAFFYEVHDYFDGTNTVKGGGARIKKIISNDAISTGGDVVTEYEYKTDNGRSSGKLQYKSLKTFSVARTAKTRNPNNINTPFLNTYYRQIQELLPTYTTAMINQLFTIVGDQDLSATASLLHGSVVGYERVTVKTKDAGWSVYDFDLPASFGDITANNNEWAASNVFIARPATGTSDCFAVPNITGGVNCYPFPPNPNYDFAKAMMKKSTDFREDGIKVRDVVYTYQRVYGNGSSIRKIYGLALEELPTYYFTGSYVDGKMFLYSKYEIFTDVKTVTSSEIETIYNSPDLVQKIETVTNYFYDSPNHRELSRIVKLNSDLTQSISRFSYVKDYIITSPIDAKSLALFNLKTAHRMAMVESTNSKIIGGTEKFIGGDLTLFQTIAGKVYPDKQYSFISNDGSVIFAPSFVSGGTTFQFDQSNYVLSQTYLSFDAYGNPIEIMGRDTDINSVVYGYNGTLPVLTIAHARTGEIKYSDFESNGALSAFTPSLTYSTCVGRNNSTGINLPAGSTNLLNGSVINTNNTWLFSCWIKASTSGNLFIQVGTGSSITLQLPYSASIDWKYYTFKNPIGSLLGNPTGFWVKVWSDAAIQLDDMALYPDHVDFVAYTYKIPFGKASETDSRAISYFYDYDQAGRLKTIYDLNRNVVKKYDYQVRP